MTITYRSGNSPPWLRRGGCRGVIPASNWLKSNPRRSPTDEVVKWQCVPVREGAVGQEAKDRAVSRKVEPVDKAEGRAWPSCPPCGSPQPGRGEGATPSRTSSGCAGLRGSEEARGEPRRPLPSGWPRYSGTDAPGDQKDAKAGPSPSVGAKRRSPKRCGHRHAGSPVGRGVRASIVPNPCWCKIGRQEEDEKAKLVRGKGTQEFR